MRKKRVFIAWMAVMFVATACASKNNSPGVFPTATTMENEIPSTDSSQDSFGETSSAVEATLPKDEFQESMAVMAETTGADYSIAAVENESGETEYRFVPTKFPVYTDGESHYLMYGANKLLYMYAPFTNVTYPEYRVASISLPSQMVEPENGREVLGKDNRLYATEMRTDVLYDSSARYSTDEIRVYSIEASSFIFRMWSLPYTGDPKGLDTQKMLALYTYPEKMYDLDEKSFEFKQLSEGIYQYSTVCFLRDYVDDGEPNAFARYVVVISEGQAYCYLAAGYRPDTAFWLGEYVLKHSFKFQ